MKNVYDLHCIHRLNKVRAAIWIVLAMLPAIPKIADGIECRHAAIGIEQTICGNAGLKKRDSDMGALYAHIRSATRTTVTRKFDAQQRRWLSDRDMRCRDLSSTCLINRYDERIAQLLALDARVGAGEPILPDVMPVILMGHWKVANVINRQPFGQDALSADLTRAGLPPFGTIIRGAPGQLCYAGEECQEAGWEPRSLGQTSDAAATMDELDMPATNPAYLAIISGRATFLLIQRPDGHLLADFTACSAALTDCHGAFEEWVPISSDAVMRVMPQ